MFHKKKSILIFSSAIIIAIIIFVYFNFKNKTLVQVGDYSVTAQDIQYRNQIQHIFYPKDPNNYGQDQLIQAFAYAQILKNNGIEISERILREEEMRINQNSKDPETLKKINALFKNDDEYRKVFVLPTYAERTIYFDFFIKNTKVQEQAFSRVIHFLEAIKQKNISLKQAATENHLSVKNLIVSKKYGLEISSPVPGVAKQNKQNADGGKFWNEILNQLKVGEVHPAPIDFGSNWIVIECNRKISSDRFAIEVVSFPKENFQHWIQVEKDKIPITYK